MYRSSCVLLLLLLPITAQAGGVLFGAGDITSTHQHVALVVEPSRTTLVMQLGYSGSGGPTAWVIPTTGNVAPNHVTLEDGTVIIVDDLRRGSSTVFERLHAETAPSLIRLRTDRHNGCGGKSKIFPTPIDAAIDDEVIEIDADTIDFEEVTSDIVGYLQGWGYAVSSEASQALEAHEGFFVVVHYADLPAGAGLLPPVIVGLRDRQTSIPLATSVLSTDSNVELLYYVIAPERYQMVGIPTPAVEVSSFSGGDFDNWYEEHLAAALDSATPPVFAVEFADFVSQSVLEHVLGRDPNLATIGAVGWFVTRFHARLAPGEFVDVTVDPIDKDPHELQMKIHVFEGGETPASMGIAALLLYGLMRVRRRWR